MKNNNIQLIQDEGTLVQDMQILLTSIFNKNFNIYFLRRLVATVFEIHKFECSNLCNYYL